jgi:hypothetical protein
LGQQQKGEERKVRKPRGMICQIHVSVQAVAKEGRILKQIPSRNDKSLSHETDGDLCK